MFQGNNHQRRVFHRAFVFTTAITGGVQAANGAGITLQEAATDENSAPSSIIIAGSSLSEALKNESAIVQV